MVGGFKKWFEVERNGWRFQEMVGGFEVSRNGLR